MHAFTKILLAVIMFFFISGCGMMETTETDKIVECKENFNDALDDFENSRSKVNEKISKAFEIQPLLSQENPDVVKISRTWEVNWKRIKEKFEDMNEDFNNVNKVAEKYFTELNKISIGIENTDMRNNDLMKNKQMKEYWLESYKSAANEIEDFDKILTEGDDYSKIFQTASVRSEIEQKISDLAILLEKARKPIMNLKQLKIDGHKLTKGELQTQTTHSDNE